MFQTSPRNPRLRHCVMKAVLPAPHPISQLAEFLGLENRQNLMYSEYRDPKNVKTPTQLLKKSMLQKTLDPKCRP